MPPQMENKATASPRVLTIGHSNHTVEHFLGLLKAHAVQVVVDARSQPYSKYATQFDHEALKLALQDAGIRYLYLGRELGGRPEGDEFYDGEGHVLYDRVAATSPFSRGVVAAGAGNPRIQGRPALRRGKSGRVPPAIAGGPGAASIAEFRWSTFAATAGFKRKRKSPPKRTRIGIN